MTSFLGKMLVIQKNFIPLHSLNKRALSSAGLEHLPYKQRVGGSNPSAPTKKLEHLPYKQRVGGSNPSAPTKKGCATCTSFFVVSTSLMPTS